MGNICVLDWGMVSNLLAIIVPSVVALYIAYQWKIQKKAEVFAEVAKTLLQDLFILDSHLIEHNAKVIINFKKSDVGEILKLIEVIRLQLLFVNKELYTDELETSLDLLYTKLIGIVDVKTEEQERIKKASMALEFETSGQYSQLKLMLSKLYKPLRKIATYDI